MSVTQIRKQGVVDRLTSGLESLLKGRKVTVIPGTGTLAPDGKTIRVSDGTEVRGANVMLATGSTPRALPLPGLDYDGAQVLSSDHVLQLGEVPARVAVVGGGAIGCEFASFLVDVGAEVTILEVLPQILTGVDQQVAQTVVRAFTKRGMKVRAGVKVIGVDRGRARVLGPLRRQRRSGGAHGRPSRRERRPQAPHRRHRARSGAGESRRAWVRRGRREHADVGRRRLRGRRRREHAAARACRLRGSDRRDQDDARRRSAAARIRQGPVGNLLPSRSGILRADRGTGDAKPATTSSPPCTGGWETAGR